MRPASRRILLVLFLGAVLAYPLGRLFGRQFPPAVSDGLVLIGAFYLAFMVYFFLALVLIDLFRCGRFMFRLFIKPESRPAGIPVKPVFLILIGLVSLIVLLGHWNARTLRVRTLNLSIPRQAGLLPELTLVLASDLHLGRIIHNHRLEEIVALINRQNPDMVLLPGDLTDEDISFLAERNTAAVLKKIKAPLGTFAVTGNHEYYGGKNRAVAFLQQGGIRVLEDEVVQVGGLLLAGRRDRTAGRFGEERKSLNDLLRGVPRESPLILMDHQPFHLEEARQNGVELQLSGHTHNGQLFPFNWVVGRLFETGWGYLEKGPTRVYVSCGVGTWGPPVRTSSVPEIVKINLRFQGVGGDRSPAGSQPPPNRSPGRPPRPGPAAPGPGPAFAPTGR
jgi:predicted MPP superfamily phosphohydrolase